MKTSIGYTLVIFLLSVSIGLSAQTDADLSNACKAGDLSAVKAAVKAGSNVNALRPDGSPIMTDGMFWPEILQYLIDEGANPNGGTYPILMIAANTYCVPSMKVLLKNGADVKKAQVKTSIHPIANLYLSEQAKPKPNKKVLKLFKEQMEAAGASTEPIKTEKSIIEEVVKASNCTECLSLLLANGADANKVDMNGNSMLMSSASSWMSLEENFQKFGDMLENQFGFKVPGWYYENIKKGNAQEELKLLVEAGANVNYTNPVNKTSPLLAALGAKNAEGSKFLIEKGADIHVQTPDKRDVLSASTALGDVDLVKMIVEKGADINAEIYTLDQASGQFAKGFTALTMAVIHNDIEIAKYLIEAGCKPKEGVHGYHINPKTKCRYKLKNKTAIYYAIENENMAMVEMLTNSFKRWSLNQMEMKQPENSSETTIGNVKIKTTYCYKISGKFTPSNYAKKSGFKEIASFLKSKGL